MSSFLSKVFGRKKDDKGSPRSPGRVSDPSLLEGKFEAVSPSATTFPEATNGKIEAKGKERDAGFTLFRAKSRPASPVAAEKRSDYPHLSLNLPIPKDDSSSRALGVVFEADPDAKILLSDSVIGNRRLNPSETLSLVRACSEAITTRGLESLGIMHPHWYSASPEIQRRLISLFIQSLPPTIPITTLSPTSSAFGTAFESEISSTRSPHDVAAVLRWGLRHLQLEGKSFGKEDAWYKTFFDAERSSNYPAQAFTSILAPQLPASHVELLTATLEIFSSLAAHAEANGISGSKLSKFFGLWLLTTQRAEVNDDWPTFYARWEYTGRVLEHLFLARIRDEAVGLRMPVRLLELVKQYPYNKNHSSSESDLLPRPRFSTRQYDALFVRVETELPATAEKPKHHPLRLIDDAFSAEITAESGSYTDLWEFIRRARTDESNPSPGEYTGLSRVFADETIRFLSLIPVDSGDKVPTSPTFSFSIGPAGATRGRSFSLSDGDKAAAVAAAKTTSRHKKPATDPATVPTTSTIGNDWAEFSTSGFFEDSSVQAPLAATLLDKEKDTEVTIPKRTIRSKPISITSVNGRKSLDTPRTTAKVEDASKSQDVKVVSKSTNVVLIHLDEAFIDFWSDALLDPISANWPAFVICKLKHDFGGTDFEVDGRRLEWLVIEQAFKRPAPPPVSSDGHATASASSPESAGGRRPRPSSPKSFTSDLTFSSTRKRFSFFGRSSISSERGTKKRKNAAGTPKIGEMGEILQEVDEKEEKRLEKDKKGEKKEKEKDGTVKLGVPSPKPKKSVEVAVAKKSGGGDGKANGNGATGLGAAAAVATGAAVVAAVDTSSEANPAEAEPEAPIPPPKNGSAVDGTVVTPPEVIAVPVTGVAQPPSNGSAEAHEAPTLVTEMKLQVPEKSLNEDEKTVEPTPIAPVNPEVTQPAAPTVLLVKSTPVQAEINEPAPAAEDIIEPVASTSLELEVAEPIVIHEPMAEASVTPTPASPIDPIATPISTPGSSAPNVPEVTKTAVEETVELTPTELEPIDPEVPVEPTPTPLSESVATQEVPVEEIEVIEPIPAASFEPEITEPEPPVEKVAALEASAEPEVEASALAPMPFVEFTAGDSEVPKVEEPTHVPAPTPAPAELEVSEPIDIPVPDASVEEPVKPVVEPVPAVYETVVPTVAEAAEPTPVSLPTPVLVEPEVIAHKAAPFEEVKVVEAVVAADETEEESIHELEPKAAAAPVEPDVADLVATKVQLTPITPTVVEPEDPIITEEVAADPEVVHHHRHSEPLHVSEGDAGDHDVTLPPVPVVDVEPLSDDLQEEDSSDAQENQERDEVEEVEEGEHTKSALAEGVHHFPATIEGVVLHGDTLGPQASLDNTIESETEEDKAALSAAVAAESSGSLSTEPVEPFWKTAIEPEPTVSVYNDDTPPASVPEVTPSAAA